MGHGPCGVLTMSESKITGIYKIVCKINNKIYIGSSDDITRRWRDHKSKLNCDKHHSKYLQNCWNLYGSDNFEFVILEIIEDIGILLIKEQEYIDNLETTNPDNGFNVAKNTFALFKGRKHSEKSKSIQSIKNSGVNHWAYGKHLSEEHKLLISNVKRKIPITEETTIVNDYINKTPVIQIANKYNVHIETIYRILRKHGFSSKRGC